MKKTLIATIIAVGLMSITAHASELTEQCVVTGIDKANDRLLLQSQDGNIFLWQGIEDWSLLDIANVTFDTKGTVNRDDDEIINMKYIGYLL